MLQAVKNGFPFPGSRLSIHASEKGNLEKVRCGEDGDFHTAAENIHSFFSGLIVCGWCTTISAHKLSTLILNWAPSICVCMSWAEASRMGQNTLELQPNWRQRLWKVSLETCGPSYWSNRFFLSWASTQMQLFSSLGWNMKWEYTDGETDILL